ncbi:TMEM143 family protein [Candidatus Halobeggiatoa sp. HSG11]|nr:TMEM143 family protein [Candidatus Halobeggiatoa sp. HSG11]
MSDDDVQIIHDSNKKRFIPISKQEIVTDLLNNSSWDDEEKKLFGDFCQIFAALYHYKFHSRLEELKRCYTVFNPDNDNITKQEYSAEQQQEQEVTLVKEMQELLDNANYEVLEIDDINQAMAADSYSGLNVSVDLEDFEQLSVYYRGLATKVEQKRHWTSLYLLKKTFEVPIYQRMFILIKLKSEDKRVQELVAIKGEQFEKKAQKQVRKSRSGLPADINEQHIFLKLFKNIPRSDLEMLFPNRNIRLKMFDKIRLAVTGGAGTLLGIISTIGKIAAAALNPIAILTAFGGLIGIIIKQITNIFTQRNKYTMVLSQNLYFHNLDNNFGVMSYLIDNAEEEEGKEAILAYCFLYNNPDKDLTQKELDVEVEKYLEEKYGVSIDFEIDDGVRKLHNEGILIEQDDGVLKVLNLQKSCERIDEQWDNFFNPKDN